MENIYLTGCSNKIEKVEADMRLQCNQFYGRTHHNQKYLHIFLGKWVLLPLHFSTSTIKYELNHKYKNERKPMKVTMKLIKGTLFSPL